MKNAKFILNSKVYLLVVLCFLVLSIDVSAQIEVVPQKPKQDLKSDSVAGFRGGNQLLFEFLEANFLVNDTLASTKKGRSYAVTSTFIVDSTGKLSDIQVTDLTDIRLPIIPELKNELVRVIGMMPQWNPGKKDGKYVSSLVYLPLNFTIKSGKMKILKDNDVQKRKLGKEKWAIIIACVLLVAAIAFIGIK